MLWMCRLRAFTLCDARAVGYMLASVCMGAEGLEQAVTADLCLKREREKRRMLAWRNLRDAAESERAAGRTFSTTAQASTRETGTAASSSSSSFFLPLAVCGIRRCA